MSIQKDILASQNYIGIIHLRPRKMLELNEIQKEFRVFKKDVILG